MKNKNELDNLEIEIESALEKIDRLYDEYQELGGKITLINMLHFNDDEECTNQLRGNPAEIYNLFYSNNELVELLFAMKNINKSSKNE